jgi:hypothetical protein
MKNLKYVVLFVGVLFSTLVQAQTPTLTASEAEEVQFLLEEEKLARDVYLSFYAKYEKQVFSNIGNSEQRHLEKIKGLAEKYGVAIPKSIINDQPGEFSNPEVKALYEELMAKGNTSLEEALRVAAKIEEMDITDLREAIATTKYEDFKTTFTQLEKASNNHLRAFDRSLAKEGVTYAPVILAANDFNTIVNGDKGCSGKKGKGNGKACSGKKGEGNGKACCAGDKQQGKSEGQCKGKDKGNGKGAGCCKKASK